MVTDLESSLRPTPQAHSQDRAEPISRVCKGAHLGEVDPAVTGHSCPCPSSQKPPGVTAVMY